MKDFASSRAAYSKIRRTCVVGIILILVMVLFSSCIKESPGTATSGTTALVDEVVFVEEPDSAKATRELEAGSLQVYAGGLSDPELVRRVRASSAMGYEISYGSSAELTFNPVGN